MFTGCTPCTINTLAKPRVRADKGRPTRPMPKHIDHKHFLNKILHEALLL